MQIIVKTYDLSRICPCRHQYEWFSKSILLKEMSMNTYSMNLSISLNITKKLYIFLVYKKQLDMTFLDVEYWTKIDSMFININHPRKVYKKVVDSYNLFFKCSREKFKERYYSYSNLRDKLVLCIRNLVIQI